MKESAVKQGFSLSEKKLMLKIARETLTHYLNTHKILQYDETNLPDSFLDNLSVFVSLHKGRALRGCIGRMKAESPLYKNIQHEVISAGSNDSRFPPVKYSELPQLCIEISVLGPMIKINSPDEIELGKHGIFIKQGNASGTFLPQVASSTGWTVEEFLGYCSNDKAGIGWEGWKNADLFVYSAEIFSEKTC